MFLGSLFGVPSEVPLAVGIMEKKMETIGITGSLHWLHSGYLGFRVQGLGFRARAWGVGFRV